VGVPLEAIEHIYKHLPLTDAIVRALNSDLTVESLEADAAEIGYPDSRSN
jgi:hypothetical protein